MDICVGILPQEETQMVLAGTGYGAGTGIGL